MMPAAYGGDYTGLSDFFSTPAGKALMALSGPQAPGMDPGGRPGPAAPRGGQPDSMLALMRPSLRNAIADESGEEQLRSIRNRKPYVVHSDAVPGMSNMFFGQARDEYVDPVEMAPRWQAEEQRQQIGKNADSLDALTQLYAPRAASLGEDINDMQDHAASNRWWEHGLPIEQQKNDMAMDLARTRSAPTIQNAQTNADAKVEAARVAAEGRQPNPVELISTALAKLSSSGAFGRDRQGHPQPPPPEVANALLEQFMGQGGQPGVGAPAPAAPGGQPGPAGNNQQFDARIEGFIADGIRRGMARDRADAIRQLQDKGYIPR